MSSNNKTIARYNLASALARIGSRLLDLLIVVGILIGIAFIMFFNQVKFPAWKLLLFSILCFLLFFIYFIIIPFCTKGYTLFMKLFKLKVHSVLINVDIDNAKQVKIKNKLMFIWQLCLREMFLWMILLISFIIFSCVCLEYNDDISEFILGLLEKKSPVTASSVAASIFITLMGTCVFLSLILMINIIICSRKRSINDYLSHTVIIKTLDVSGSDIDSNNNFKKKNSINIKYGLPGEINPNAIDEIGEEKNG